MKNVLEFWAAKNPIKTVSIVDGRSVSLIDDDAYYVALIKSADGAPEEIKFAIKTQAEFAAYVATL